MRETPQVNIQDPPVTELKKKRSCVTRSCFSGCGCIVFFFIGVLMLLNLLSGSGFKQMKSIPDHFPADIELYELERTDSIRVSHKPLRGGIARTAAIIPKSLLASTYLALGESAPPTIRHAYETTHTEGNTMQRFWQLMHEPISAQSDQIIVLWYSLPAEPRFVQEFYITTLEANGYHLTVTESSPTRRHLLFEKDGTTGSVLIQDRNPNEKGTDHVELTVYLPTLIP